MPYKDIQKQREYIRNWHKENWEKRKQYCSQWIKRTKYALKNKHKISARMKVNRAIISGKIKRGNCLECNLPNSEAHHKDYSKPFDIIWLCKQHHADLSKTK
jgi:hypothetical protein